MPSLPKTRLVNCLFITMHTIFPPSSLEVALQYTHVAASLTCSGLLTQSQALLSAIREYEASKWKVIGAKVGKPAKVCQTSFHVIPITDDVYRFRPASNMPKTTSPRSSSRQKDKIYLQLLVISTMPFHSTRQPQAQTIISDSRLSSSTSFPLLLISIDCMAHTE